MKIYFKSSKHLFLCYFQGDMFRNFDRKNLFSSFSNYFQSILWPKTCVKRHVLCSCSMFYVHHNEQNIPIRPSTINFVQLNSVWPCVIQPFMTALKYLYIAKSVLKSLYDQFYFIGNSSKSQTGSVSLIFKLFIVKYSKSKVYILKTFEFLNFSQILPHSRSVS